MVMSRVISYNHPEPKLSGSLFLQDEAEISNVADREVRAEEQITLVRGRRRFDADIYCQAGLIGH